MDEKTLYLLASKMTPFRWAELSPIATVAFAVAGTDQLLLAHHIPGCADAGIRVRVCMCVPQTITSSLPLLLQVYGRARPDGQACACVPCLMCAKCFLPLRSSRFTGRQARRCDGRLVHACFNPVVLNSSLCCRFTGGHDLVTEGDPADRFWILIEGKAL